MAFGLEGVTGCVRERDLHATVGAPANVVDVELERQICSRAQHEAERDDVRKGDGGPPRLVVKRRTEVGVGRVEIGAPIEGQANAAAVGERQMETLGQGAIERRDVESISPGAAAEPNVAARPAGASRS